MNNQDKQANKALKKLIEENPDYTIENNSTEWIFGTNRVAFGSINGQPAVFKYFAWLPRKLQEEKALGFYASTGLVPKLFPLKSDSIITMERFTGKSLFEAQSNSTHKKKLRFTITWATQ